MNPRVRRSSRPRAQCDKKAYQFRLKHTLELQPNLTLFQATVTGLIYRQGTVVGCRTNLDIDFLGRSVVVTTGTFLRGLMHIGQNKNEGGRMGDFSSKTLSASLMEIGIELQSTQDGHAAPDLGPQHRLRQDAGAKRRPRPYPVRLP